MLPLQTVALGEFLNFESLLIFDLSMMILCLMVAVRLTVGIHIGYCYQTRYKQVSWKAKKELVEEIPFLHQNSCSTPQSLCLLYLKFLLFIAFSLLHPVLPTRTGFIFHLLLPREIINPSIQHSYQLSTMWQALCLTLEETDTTWSVPCSWYL